jgi:carbamoyltransferase
MIICGIKATHDSSLAFVENGVLTRCIEIEKVGNRPRHVDLPSDSDVLDREIEKAGYSWAAIDQVVLDGWHHVINVFGKRHLITLAQEGRRVRLELAPYGFASSGEDVLRRFPCGDTDIVSTMHLTNHISSAYCTSPFARHGEPAYILVWDGALWPQLWHIEPQQTLFSYLGSLGFLYGNVYVEFCGKFPPFMNWSDDRLGVAGKIMAFIGLGQPQASLLELFWSVYRDLSEGVPSRPLPEVAYDRTWRFREACARQVARLGCDPPDVMASFHEFLEQLLLRGLESLLPAPSSRSHNLCITGGCALNIKWNSAIRESGLFDSVWIPPFPNDSGSAIGAASTEYIQRTGHWHLDWDVYRGPELECGTLGNDWWSAPCNSRQLAELLARSNDPILVLHGRAELGPRALGNRSIIAPATSAAMKDRLNEIKRREPYRPVAPICTAEAAKEVFRPGTPDPYMLFEH